MSTALLLIATGKYVDFVDQVLASADRYLHDTTGVTYVVYTDRLNPQFHQHPGRPLEIREFHHIAWPFPTLLRHHVFASDAPFLSRFDRLLYCDVDMRFVADFDAEAILNGLVAVRHPGFPAGHSSLPPYESNRSSKCFLEAEAGGLYVAGGLQGGTTASYLHASTNVATRVWEDLGSGYIARWHDESHWNFEVSNTSAVTILGEEFCWPDNRHARSDAVVVALSKNHAKYRSLGLRDTIQYWLVRLRGSLASLMGFGR